MLPITAPITRPITGPITSPDTDDAIAALFANGEPGAWYDFTDAAVNWRRNLLTRTEEFDNAVWQKIAAGTGSAPVVTANAAVAPDGTTTADLIVFNRGAGNTLTDQSYVVQTPTLAAATYTQSIWLKAATGGDVGKQLGLRNAGGTGYGVVTLTADWVRYTRTETGSSANWEIITRGTITADNSVSAHVWGAQLETGSTASAYQRIVTPEISYLDHDPQPVMFQDSAGTTPVTGVEQAVGLILDKSRGVALGSERVTNGDFSSGTGWTLGSGWSIAGGLLVANPAADFSTASQTLSLTAGKTYRAQITTVSFTSGAFRLYVFDGTSYRDFVDINTPGSYQLIWTAYTASDQIRVYAYNTGAADIASFDNISVREIAGTHAIQPSAASRPVLRNRYNLLTHSEQFDNAAWQKVGLGTGSAPVVTANAATAPDGTTTADQIVFNRGAGNAVGDQSYIVQTPTLISATYTQYIWLKAATGGEVGKQLALRGAAGSGYGVVTLTADWVRYTRTETGSSGNWEVNNRGTITADNTVTAFVWGADLRSANDTAFPYQRIEAATVYDSDATKFPLYLACDGSDDSLYTAANLDLSGTDKVTVFAGVTKLSDAAGGMILETNAGNAGNIYLYAPGSPDYQWRSSGTVNSNVNSTTFAAPTTNVVTGIGDISGDVSTIRVNGAASNTNAGDQGTGNFASAPLYLFARAGTSLFFRGRFYASVIRGALTPVSRAAAVEQQLNVQALGKVY